ncbi:phage terminase small subunit P27 family, partial [Oenococcus oeni]|uniref:phage terminase small subunit P27 family n=1 Tax=Oenococcus oeni TaxID=1247 RepID=UPI000A56C157
GLEDIHISPPEHLDHIGTHLWRTLVPELRKIGTIKQIDHVSLESFCSAYSSYRLAEQDIKENGIFIKNEDGSINRTKKNPDVAIMNDSIKTLKSLSADLGLTFDARSSQLVPTQSPSKQESSKTPLGKVEF